jgi:divinyl chlorophyllide a 8-vinyl-reductase
MKPTTFLAFLVSLLIQNLISQAYTFPSRKFKFSVKSSLHGTSTNSGNTNSNKDKRVVIVGATGYIGKFVTKEAIQRGYQTIAVVRSKASSSKLEYLQGAEIIEADVTNLASLQESGIFSTNTNKPDIVISCLASRSGVKDDSFLVDYQATSNVLQIGLQAKIEQFILLSAFCVRKPLLQFQQAKLQFESELIKSHENGQLLKYSIVRPTAFFKSVSGQFELLQQGWPFVMFGNGEICQCNPIAESDLASYIVNCIDRPTQWNKVI